MEKYLKYKQKYINRIVGGTQTQSTPTSEDTPTLEYIGFENGKHVFKSLGVRDKDIRKLSYSASNLFPQGDTNTKYTLDQGKFPLTETNNLGKILNISGKTVKIIGTNISCHKDDLNKYGKCEIIVKEVK